MTKLGYQIPNFNYPGVSPDGLFEAVARQAETVTIPTTWNCWVGRRPS